MTDRLVRPKFGNWAMAVAKLDGNDGNPGRSCSVNVGNRISDHDSSLHRAACSRHSAPQNLRVRLLNAKGVLPTDRNEAISEPKVIQQKHRKTFKLVRTYRKTTISRCERLECIDESWKRSRPINHVFAVVRNKFREHLLDLDRRKNAPFSLKPSNDHRLYAAANQIAPSFVRQRGQTFSCENCVKGFDEVGRRIDQRPIKVKDNGGDRHGGIAIPSCG